MESAWPVSKLSTESVGSRRDLVANCVHTANADATQLDSFVASASAVCIRHKTITGEVTGETDEFCFVLFCRNCADALNDGLPKSDGLTGTSVLGLYSVPFWGESGNIRTDDHINCHCQYRTNGI